MAYEVKHEERYRYFEEGEGAPVILLHGLFGSLSNFDTIIDYFKGKYKLLVPLLPLYTLEVDQTNIQNMVDYVSTFIDYKGLDKVHLVGNSLGGHIAQIYTLAKPEKVLTITLTGSSGLFENSLGDTYPRKSDYEFVRGKTEEAFYDPSHATKEQVDEVYDVVNNRHTAIRMVVLAKSAVRHNLRDEIPNIQQPVCLIWGADDRITPPFVAEEFNKLLTNSEVHILPKCGHAPMMEQPKLFNEILERFLEKNN